MFSVSQNRDSRSHIPAYIKFCLATTISCDAIFFHHNFKMFALAIVSSAAMLRNFKSNSKSS